MQSNVKRPYRVLTAPKNKINCSGCMTLRRQLTVVPTEQYLQLCDGCLELIAISIKCKTRALRGPANGVDYAIDSAAADSIRRLYHETVPADYKVK